MLVISGLGERGGAADCIVVEEGWSFFRDVFVVEALLLPTEAWEFFDADAKFGLGMGLLLPDFTSSAGAD
jgi:hypothetical protein